MKKIQNPNVRSIFDAYPPKVREKLYSLRELILNTAKTTKEVGEIEETLKWGEPAYLTSVSKSGSLIRIDRRRDNPDTYAMYFHCQTNLVENFKLMFGDIFTYEKNRALIFDINDDVPTEELSMCIHMALTYNLKKKKPRQI